MKIAIRLDDITPDMNWEKFYKMKLLLDREQIKPLLGVVPENRDELLHFEEAHSDFFAKVREWKNEGYSIAQHGFYHVYETKSKGLLGLNPFSEFAGLSYECQLEKLKKGKEILKKQGIESRIFMAPGHTYDKNTLQALRECGFKYVTDGYTAENCKTQGLVFVPCRNSKSVGGNGYDTLCFHTNLMSEEDFEGLGKWIHQNRASFVDYEELLEEKALDKNLFRWFGEKKRLWLYRGKRFAGHNTGMQKYFQVSYHKDKKMRLIKRILYLPYLLLLLILPPLSTKEK